MKTVQRKTKTELDNDVWNLSAPFLESAMEETEAVELMFCTNPLAAASVLIAVVDGASLVEVDFSSEVLDSTVEETEEETNCEEEDAVGWEDELLLVVVLDELEELEDDDELEEALLDFGFSASKTASWPVL